MMQMSEAWPDILYEGYVYVYMDISIPTQSHSQISLAAAEAPSLKISFYGTSLKWSQRPSQSAQE